MAKRTRSQQTARIASEIQHYLRTGEYDSQHSAWPGNIIECGQAANEDLLGALVAEVQRRSEGLPPPACLPEVDLREFVRQKVEPMVRGLFPARGLGRSAKLTHLCSAKATHLVDRLDRSDR